MRRILLAFCCITGLILLSCTAAAQVQIAELSAAPGNFTAGSTLVFEKKPADVAYITDPGAGRILKFQPTTGVVLSILPIMQGLGPAVLTPDGKTLVVLGVTSQKLYMVDTASMTVIREAGYANSSFTYRNNLQLSQDGKKIFISDPSRNQVSIFNVSDGALDRHLNVGINPNILTLLPGGNRIAVLCSGNKPEDTDSIHIIDTFNEAVVDSRNLTATDAEAFNNIQFSKDGGFLYIPIYRSDRIAVYDTGSGILSSRSSYGKGPSRILTSPDGRLLAIVNALSKSVAILNLPEALLSKEIQIEGLDLTTDSALAFSPDSRSLFIPSTNKNEVIEYRLDTSTILRRIRAGKGPTALNISADEQLLISLNPEGNDLTIVALSPRMSLIPHLIQDPSRFSGLALANFGPNATNVALYARDDGGELLSGTTNPRILNLNSGSQISQITAQIFGLDPRSNLEGWIEAYTLSDSVSTLYLSGSVDQSQLDGFLALSSPSTLLGFSRVTERATKFGSETSTEISIVNPNDRSASLTLRMYGRNLEGPAELLSHVTRTIAPHARLRQRVSDLLPAIYPVERAYLEVTSDVQVAAIEIVKIGDSIAMIPAKNRGLPDTSFLATQFASGGAGTLDTPIFSSVSFCNTSPLPVTITVEITDDQAKPLPAGSAPLVRKLEPFETLAGTADQIFGFPDPLVDPGLYVGTMKITADSPGLIGDVLFGDARHGAYLTSLSLQQASSTEFEMPHFAKGRFGDPAKGLYTGLAFYNPNRDTVEITVEAFTPTHDSLGKASFEVQARQRRSRTMGEILPSIRQQNGGTLRVTSTLPIYVFEVFGSTESEFLAAVPPVIIP